MPQQRITTFSDTDRVLSVKDNTWGTVIAVPAESDATLIIQLDTGEIVERDADLVNHYYDQQFQRALAKIKEHITEDETAQNRDLHEAIQLLVDCHRLAIDWR
jgi:hypothetical protein